MAETAAFIYGWIAGIFAVIVWILYGIDTLLQLMRVLNIVLNHFPGLSYLASGSKEKRKGSESGSGSSGALNFNVMSSGDGLEGLTGSTKRVTPITAGGLCMMSWYGPDGTTGPPIECRLSLENNEVTIYQLLRLGDTNAGASGATSSSAVGSDRASSGQAGTMGSNSRKGNKGGDATPFRSAAGVTVAEHRKGRVAVLQTTVMELRHFNRPKKSNNGESNENNNTGGSKSSASRKGCGSNANHSGSEAGSVDASQPKSRGGGGGANAGTSDVNSQTGSKHKRKESGSGRDSATDDVAEEAKSGTKSRNNNNNDDLLADGTTRPGVDPLFTGRVLIWRTMDGRPLFDSIHAPKRATGVNFLGTSLRGNVNSFESFSQAGSGSIAGGSVGSFVHSASADSLYDDRSMYSLDDNSDGGDDALSDYNGSVDEQQYNRSSTEMSKRKSYAHGRGRRGQRNKDMKDMDNWSCVIIKFERARESERWHTLLSGLHEARAWHDFAKMLPNPDTVNTFLSRFFFQNMRVNGLHDIIVRQIRKKLRELPSKKFPRNLGGQLVLDEFLIGTQIPWISDVSEPTISANGEVGFDFNLMYKGGEGGFTLFFRLALEFLGIRVPHVVFSVKLIELEATVHISIGPPPSKKFWIGGHKPPILRLEVRQGCASGKGILHRVLTSLPDLSGVVTNLIKLYLFSDMVLPYMDDFPLPSVVKSPKTSLRDLRVRTFDWQRAAKISGAPERANATSAEERVSDTSKLKEAGLTNARADAVVVPKQPGDKSVSRQPSSGTSPAPSEKDEKKKDAKKHPSQPGSTPRSDADAGATSNTQNNKGQNLAASPSVGSKTVREVASPITLTSPSNPSVASSRNTPGTNHNASSDNPQNSATGNNNDNALSRALFLDAERTESEDTLSSTNKKRGGNSSAMRNLKNLLKVKGKDMTRESVSRSKDRSKGKS